MLGELNISNFKTHEDTTLKFSPGINVITGDSGHGKTNILLALSWVKDNRPLGMGGIRRGQSKPAIVTATVIDNEETCSVVRKRGKSENIYDILKDGVSILDPPFTSFGNSPPQQISDILKLSEINVQKQRDQHFLVYSPPGQIATYIRSITKLDEIDKVTKSLTGKIRTEKSEISHKQAEFKIANDRLEFLNQIDLELLENKIAEAKDRILKNKKLKEKIERITDIVESIKTLEKHWIQLPDDVDKIFEDVDFGIEAITKVNSQIFKLQILITKIKKIEACKITLPEDLTILSTVEEAMEKYSSIRKKIRVLHRLLREINDIESKIGNSNEQLEQMKLEEKQLEAKLDACPYCGTALSRESRTILLGAEQ